MAKLRPTELPEEVKNEPFRQSEIVFFDAAKKLPDSWHVLYGVTWFLRVRKNSWSEGEADFVIISPDVGIVIVEIKGGRIGRDDEGWYSIDRFDEIHRIKDPIQQAANCKYRLIEYIHNNSAFANRFIPARHMVCFPNISLKDATKLIEMPREMQIFAEDLDDLSRVILAFAKLSDSEASHNKLTVLECKQITDILKPNFNYPNRWSVQANRQNSIIESLTDEQMYIWDIIEGNNRISLSGPAGSGKTLLAIKLAKKVIDESKKVLVLVPTKSLQEYYSSSIGSEIFFTNSYQIDITVGDQTKYDLIIIDEAQDLSEEHWLYLYETYQIETSARLLCIFDSNQRLNAYGTSCPFEKLIELRLTRILRNTKQIAEFTTRFFSGKGENKIIGPTGLQVQYTSVNLESDLVSKASEIIKHYVFDENFDFVDIVVLFGKGGESKFKKMANVSNCLGVSFRSLRGVYDSNIHKLSSVIAETVFSYRGLESKIVILTGIDNLSSDTLMNTCYVGASRARNILHVVATTETIKTLQHIDSILLT